MASPAIAVFLAIGIDQVGKVFGNLHISPKWVNAVTGIILGILVLQGYYFYFDEYRSGHYLQDFNSELVMETGIHLAEMDPHSHYYLFGSPWVFAKSPTTVFIAPYNPKMDLRTDMIEALEISDQWPSFFVAIPHNKADLERIATRFPGGEWDTVYRKTLPEVLYYAYTFSP